MVVERCETTSHTKVYFNEFVANSLLLALDLSLSFSLVSPYLKILVAIEIIMNTFEDNVHQDLGVSNPGRFHVIYERPNKIQAI